MHGFLMKYIFAIIICFSLFASKSEKEMDIEKVSESIGFLIGKHLEGLGVSLDSNEIAKGIESAYTGKTSPLSEEECYQAISLIQESKNQEKAVTNLKETETFLKENASKKGIIEIEKGKLQYEIIKEGKNCALEIYHTPLVQYKGRLLNGTEFGATEEAECICLDGVIEGFRKGLIGMQEGEKRILYVHPELGYGNSGFFPPNALLIFEIEVIRADGSLKLGEMLNQNKEIALPVEDQKKIR